MDDTFRLPANMNVRLASAISCREVDASDSLGRSPMLQTRRVGSVAAAQRCTKPTAYKIELLTRIQAPTLIMFGRKTA